jgi:hypothetical protein
MKPTKIFLLLVVLIGLCAAAHAQNQLKNPGFEKLSEGWIFWGGVQQKEVVRSGSYAMKVALEQPRWSGAEQFVFLPEGITKIKVSGWMKTDRVVQGKLEYERARIAVEFQDDNGNLVGGYYPVVAQQVGSTDWTYYTNTYFPPAGARQLKIQTTLANCTGAAYYDDLEVELLDIDGNNMEAATKTGPTSEGKWYKLDANPKNSGSHYVDWSSLLDAPAGKHGFLKIENGKLFFGDGTPARFWGTNLVAGSAFPSARQADSVAQRLAQMGCNLIRLHHMDAPWSVPNIFGNTNSSRKLSPQSLGQLDYLVAALKKKGIYIYLDLLVHRDFSEADGVANRPPDLGGKQVGYFDDKIIELQKEYIRNLLNHVNPHTGLAYKDEPAIIGSEFINESSAFLHFGGDILTEPYRKQLQEKFEVAGNKGKKLSVFELDYSQGASPRLAAKKGAEGDVAASIRFLSELERTYYQDMKQLMRSLGVKYPLAGSNFPIPVLAYQFDNYQLNETVITNDYWDHPQLWKMNDDWSRILYAPINNISMLKNPSLATVNNIAKYKWNNRPFMVTEYNACYPNEYILEAIPFIAAYTRLQDIDGMMQFDFDLNAVGQERITPFGLSKMPDHLAQWVVGAPMFLRGDVKPAQGLVLDNITDKQIYGLPNYSDFLDENYHLTYITKVAKSYNETSSNTVQQYDSFFDKKNQVIRSETGELKLDAQQGILEVNTDKIQGAVGNLKDLTVEFPFLSFKIKNKWASVFLVSADGRPLAESRKMYLVAVTPVRMEGQQFNVSRSALESPGTNPIMAQQMEGEVIIRRKTDKVRITPRMADGTKGKNINFVTKGTGISLKMNDGRTFVYEIELE